MTGEIDLTDWIREARPLGRFKDTEDLMEKHGGGTNKNGVFENTETVRLAGSGKSFADGDVVKTPNGVWLYGYDFHSPNQGSSGPANVWSRVGYENREDALAACAEDAIVFFQGVSERVDSCTTDAHRREARQIVETLTPKEPPPQMSLFDLLTPITTSTIRACRQP